MTINNRKSRFIEFAIAGVVLLFCEWFFFRNVIGTQTGALISDRGDGRLTNLLTEHWWNFFCGREKFSEIAMFYPAEDVFGYTDLFLGFGLIHSLFRSVGVNMFIAYKWTLLIIHVMGSVTMYYLLKRKLNCSLGWSLFGTIAFCYSNTYAIHIGHTQLNAISYLPLLLIFFIGLIQHFSIRTKRNIYAYCLIIWFVLLTYTSWYTACFTGVFCLILLVVYFIVLVSRKAKIKKELSGKLKQTWKDFIGYLLVMIVLFIPFIKVYLPVMKASSGYSYEAVTSFLPEFADIINVTESNFLLGGFIKEMGLSSRGYSGEVAEGFSIILLVLFFFTFFIQSRCFKKKAQVVDSGEKENIYTNSLLSSIFISVLVGIVLVIRLSANGCSFWWLVYSCVPVVRSMRAVARFFLWLSFPMAVVTAYTASKYFKASPRVSSFVQCIAVLLVFLSNINTNGVCSSWNARDELNYLSNVADPPEKLESFYILDSAHSGDEFYIYQLDAFEIATWYGIKTINGYSGQLPEAWDAINDPSTALYEFGVYSWVEKYGLDNVYAYDRAANIWIPFEERISILKESVFCPSDNKFSLCLGLKDHNKGDFSWTSQNFEVQISNPEIKKTGLVIRMRPQLTYYMAQNPDLCPEIEVFVDGKFIQNVTVTDDPVELLIPMTNHVSDDYDIEIKTNCYFNPKKIGINEDTRDLSLALYYIGN